MDCFDTVDEMWLDAAAKIKTEGQKVGSRDGESTEILGYAARLNQPSAHFMFNPHRKISPSYAAAEFLWYMSGDAKTSMIEKYAPQYGRFAKQMGGHNYALGSYGHRWKNAIAVMDYKAEGWITPTCPQFDQVKTLIELLKRKPETRQAVITMYHPWDLLRAENPEMPDVPCTICLHFIMREGQLNLVATMRSNDVWLGMPYDVYCFCSLLILVAYAVGVQPGWYQHQATSLHLYERNREKFEEAANPSSFACGPLEYKSSFHNEWERVIQDAIRLEGWNRNNGFVCEGTDTLGCGSLLREQIVMMGHKWDLKNRAPEMLWNPMLKDYVRTYWSHVKKEGE